MNMLVKLKTIAKIKSGYPFRERLQPNPNGNVFVLQAKNVVQDQDITILSSLEQINLNFKNNNIFLQYNDVVFVSKTGPQADFRSTVFKFKKDQVIFSNTMLSIRLETDEVLPDYLSLYLNSNECRKDLNKLNSGTHTKHITPSALSELDIPIPPPIIQQSLIDLNKNILDQEKIYEKKVKLKKQIINKTLTNIINKNN